MSAYKTKVAFAVQEDTEGTGGIVFSRSSIEALRKGASTFGDGDIHGWSARRAQWADSFAATGEVPMAVAVECGWWSECHGCGRTISQDDLDERGLPASGVIGSLAGATYCCQQCVDDEAS